MASETRSRSATRASGGREVICRLRRGYHSHLPWCGRRRDDGGDLRRGMNCQANLLIFSSPLGSQNRFFPFFITDTLVCIPLPFTPTTGFGRKLAVSPIRVATCRQISLYN